ncbi:MAG: ubiquinone biosynthesis regulatory protein kinase UbiB [Coxiella sp. (in: Bacteria)]|nr:MAG: ubiquinone biosynthesis regulatory protein kinase UbiB [Coxiella sp. (in: g-proteobacteria)]
MLKPIHIIRLLQINTILMRTNFMSSVLGQRFGFFRFLRFFNPWYYTRKTKPRGITIRETLESLGPIYVKFGQMLSTRADLIPEDIIDELKKLQDNVPPFDGLVAQKIIEESFSKTTDEMFAQFEVTPLASASVAQVHAATLKNGDKVIAKVIRPNIAKTIKKDIAVLNLVALLTERFWRHGKRLRPVEVVKEFEETIYGELDMQREAANASLLRRNFENEDMLYVPKVYWEFVSKHVMVMERIYGIPLNDIEAIKASGADLHKLSKNGVEIFFTQVFRDSFFHADMHPGNMFIDVKDPQNPRYLGVDFGIMGTLNQEDQHYLAMNLLAFFNRDYRRVAELHVECGWVAPDTRIDQFETAIRTVCEPIFEKPLAEISFGKLLLRLFQTAERFDMEVQPQLILLQKTLFSIESLGRQLYPNLDLWETAKPFMTRWLKEQRGVTKLLKLAASNFHETTEKLLKTPQLLYDALSHVHMTNLIERQIRHKLEPKHERHTLIGAIGVSLLIVSITNLSLLPGTPNALTWSEFGVGCALTLFAIVFRKQRPANS